MIALSIIVPVYNVENYLRKCLDSLVKQTFKLNYEIICVNDGSTDNSGLILKEYADKYNNIKIITQENKGLGAARYSGISVAQGEYIGIVDSDDYVSDDYFEKLYQEAKKQDADIAATNQVLTCSNNRIIGKKDCGIKPNATIINTKEDKAEIIITTGICWNKIYKRDFLNKYDLCHFGERQSPGTDNFFTTCSVIRANKIAINNDAAYYYVLRENSITRTIKGKKQFGIFKNYASIDKWINNQSDFSEYEKQYWKYINNKRKQRDFKVFYNTMKPEYQDEFLSIAKQNLKIDNLIISLTSYPERINTVNQAIETLLNQSLNASKVVLWLAEEQFPNKEKDLPQQLLDLIPKGLEIDWCEDIKSYKKLIPAIKKYPDSIIVTADDDLIYKNDWLEQLYNAYIQEPQYIHCHRGHYITFEQNEVSPYKKWIRNISTSKPSFNNFFTGNGGILYPPNCFYKDILRKDLFTKLCPLADDIWFWAMCVLNDKKLNIVSESEKLVYVDGTQESTLWHANIIEGKNDTQLKKVINHYPELLEKLDKDNNLSDLQMIYVSIVIPVYNVEKYLERCLNSVLRQYFPKDRYEIICVDDGSSDNSPQILNDYAQKYQNIKVISLKKSSETQNTGPSDARNTGVENAKGKYILFVDSDDFIARNALSVLYDYAEKNNSDVVFFDFYKGKPGMAKPEIRHYTKIADKYEHKQFNAETAEPFVYRFIPVAPWEKFYRRDLIKNIKFIKNIFYQDVPYWDLVYLNAKRMNYLPYVLYYYDATGENRITTAKNKRVFDVFKAYNASRQILTEYGYFEKFKYIMYSHACCYMVKNLKNVNEDLRKDYIEEIKNFIIDVSVEDFLKEDFFDFEYENFKIIKYIQQNDYNTVVSYLKKLKIVT